MTFLSISLPSLLDLGTDIYNAYEFLNGAIYEKTVANPSDNSLLYNYKLSVINCTLVGNYTELRGDFEKTFYYECLEVDTVWGLLTLLFVFTPGLWVIRCLSKSEGAFNQIGWFKKTILCILGCITFPIQLLCVKIIQPFAGDEWNKVGILYSSAEAMFEEFPQLILQLFIIFNRADRYPSAIQWISVLKLLPKLLDFEKNFDPKPLKENDSKLQRLPFHLFEIVATSLIISVIRWSYFFIVLPVVVFFWILYHTTYEQTILVREKVRAGTIFHNYAAAGTLIVLLIGVNCFPEHEWLITGYPHILEKPSSLEIIEEKDLDFMIFSLTISWFNLLAPLLILIFTLSKIWYWWNVERTVKVSDKNGNQYYLEKHQLKKSKLEDKLNEVDIDGKSYFIPNEDLKHYDQESYMTFELINLAVPIEGKQYYIPNEDIKQYHLENQCTVMEIENSGTPKRYVVSGSWLRKQKFRLI